METVKKPFVGFCRVAGRCVVLGALALAGCVADSSPRGYYGAQPNNYSTYNVAPGTTVVAPVGSTVFIQDDNGQQPAHDYDNHWDYGRRGNGNFHGTGDDDVHDD